jgi:CRISPR-associated protein Cmr4
MSNDPYEVKEIYAVATDPIYIGTGGYTIGRVDNTIVRDPATRIPKIPGSSLAGTWRYYVTLEAHKYFRSEEYKINRSSRKDKKINDIFNDEAPNWIKGFEGNRYIAIKCAGQDDSPNKTFGEMENFENSGHCGRCIVCKAFGYSKSDK